MSETKDCNRCLHSQKACDGEILCLLTGERLKRAQRRNGCAQFRSKLAEAKNLINKGFSSLLAVVHELTSEPMPSQS